MLARFGINDDLTGIPSWGIYVISIFIMVVAIRGVKVLGRLGRFFLFMWAFPILGGCILTLIFQVDLLKTVRYFSVVLIIQTALFGAGFISLWQKIAKIRYALTAGLIVISLFLVLKYVTASSATDWRILAEKIQAHKQRREQVLFIGKSDKPIRYYYKGFLLSNEFFEKWREENPDKDLEKYLLTLSGSRLLMVNSPRFLKKIKKMDKTHRNFSRRLYDLVMKNYRIRKELLVSQVKLLHLEKSAPLREEAD